MEFHDTFSSPLGMLYITFSGKALTGMSFSKPKLRAGKAPGSFKAQLRDYFGGRLREFEQAAAFKLGTEFERKVWQAIRDIPYGETRTYKWLAQQVGSPNGSRAVGQALSKNPIAIVFPCHRVVESQGKIGGYSGGVDIKRRLLALEYYHAKEAGAL
jgi:methylated-DNA-[protein]-cysteine S-methyltransferase